MRDLVISLSRKIDCNPRSLKRILNVLQVISEVVKVMQVNNGMSFDFVVVHKLWPQLSRKIAVWVFLCEAFPYRMSFLVRRLQDFNKKISYNNTSCEKKRIMLFGSVTSDSTDGDPYISAATAIPTAGPSPTPTTVPSVNPSSSPSEVYNGETVL